MQTLGISDTTPPTESRWRALFWPTIRNEADLDLVTRQGFWICFIVATLSLVISLLTGQWAAQLFESLFYFLGGFGVRQRSRVAGIAVFVAYLLSTFVLQIYTGNGFGIVRIIFLALLLANIRGNWLASKWVPDAGLSPESLRLNETFLDKLVDQLPTFLWPKFRYAFYVLAALELLFLLVALLWPLIAPGPVGRGLPI